MFDAYQGDISFLFQQRQSLLADTYFDILDTFPQMMQKLENKLQDMIFVMGADVLLTTFHFVYKTEFYIQYRQSNRQYGYCMYIITRGVAERASTDFLILLMTDILRTHAVSL